MAELVSTADSASTVTPKSEEPSKKSTEKVSKTFIILISPCAKIDEAKEVKQENF